VKTPRARAGIAAAALAAAVTLFIVFAGGDQDGTDSAATTTAPQSAQGTTGAEPREPQAPPVERIVVRAGKPVGGVKRLEYEGGERVRLSVRSDVADEVHVHGFDIKKNVRVGASVRFGFPADIEGVFEVELEDRKIEIAELRVKP
jgi:hypothetical protein